MKGKTYHLKDYKPCSFKVSHIDLVFQLDSKKTKVTALLKIEPLNTTEKEPLILDGQSLKLLGLWINGKK